MTKWSNFKKQFVRELGKTKTLQNGLRIYTTKWALFQSLLFLKDTDNTGPNISNHGDVKIKPDRGQEFSLTAVSIGTAFH